MFVRRACVLLSATFSLAGPVLAENDEAELSVPVLAEDGSIRLPSGLVVNRQEVRLEPVGAVTHGVTTVRLRYVSTQLEEKAFPFERIEGDFAKLCSSFGLKIRSQSAPQAEQVIISIASRPTAFGETAPNVVQYFDAFRVEQDTCVWDGL